MDSARGREATEARRPAVGVLRGGALGDFVLTLPALASLCRAFPGHAVRMIGRPDHLRLARPDRVLDQDSAALAPLYLREGAGTDALRAFFADVRLFLAYAVDPDGALASRLSELVPGEVLVHNPHPPPGFGGHTAEHLLAPLRQRGLPADDAVPLLRLRPHESAWAAARWHELGAVPHPVLLHPGSGAPRKCWPLDAFAELAARLRRQGAQVIVLEGPVETERPAARLPCPVLRPPGALELAGALQRAALFVGNDSGPGHLAAALGRPTLSLFGPTDPRLWRPRGPCCRVLRAPCGEMASLPVEQVLAAAIDLLEAGPDPAAGPGAEPRGRG